MPPDEEVVEGLRGFLQKVADDVAEFGHKIEVELKERLIKEADTMSKLLDAKPIDKAAVEEIATRLKKSNLEIGQSIYKKAAEEEKKKKE